MDKMDYAQFEQNVLLKGVAFINRIVLFESKSCPA